MPGRPVTGLKPFLLISMTIAIKIMVSELITGAITGPVQMIGKRNKISVVSSVSGHPRRVFRNI